jgi:hypothetical protein
MAAKARPQASGKTKPGDVSERVGVEQIRFLDVGGTVLAFHQLSVGAKRGQTP